jgi:transposase-like protein
MRKVGGRGNWSETMKRPRRQHSTADKIKLLRFHLIERQPISKICEEAKIAPSLFHRWQEQLFANGAQALKNKYRPERNKDKERIEKLEGRIRQKDEVLAELMAEHVAPKKNLGSCERRLGRIGPALEFSRSSPPSQSPQGGPRRQGCVSPRRLARP